MIYDKCSSQAGWYSQSDTHFTEDIYDIFLINWLELVQFLWESVSNMRQYCCEGESYENPSQRFKMNVIFNSRTYERGIIWNLTIHTPMIISRKYFTLNIDVLTGIIIWTSCEVCEEQELELALEIDRRLKWICIHDVMCPCRSW